MIAAGRTRGIDLAQKAGLAGKGGAPQELAAVLNSTIGEKGTRLCEVVSLSATADGFLVKVNETVCTSDEPPGSTRTCTYTLGAILGFLETVYGYPMRGAQVANTLTGSATDDLQFFRV
jgi:hypothetical protein